MFTILIILAVLAVVWVISTTNGFKRKEIKIDEALSGIEVALTKRYDTLTKLLDTSKGFMEHESDLFADVISLRSGMSVNEMGKADREMGELTGRIFAVAENYPELRSSEAFSQGCITPTSAATTRPSQCSPPACWRRGAARRSFTTRTTPSSAT